MASRIENALKAAIDGTPYDEPVQSRVEDIIKHKIDGVSYDKPIQSRVEYLLNQYDGGGGLPPGYSYATDEDIDDLFDDD